MVALPPLVARGWLPAAALEDPPAFDTARVDWGAVIPWRRARLQEAAAGFFAGASAHDRARLDRARLDRARFEAWCEAEATWLPAWTFFAALKDAYGGQPW